MSGQLQGASGNGEATLEQIPEPSTAFIRDAVCQTSCSITFQSIKPCTSLVIASTREHLSICHVSQESQGRLNQGVVIDAAMRPAILVIRLSIICW